MKSSLLQVFNNSGTREDLSITVDTGAVYLHGTNAALAVSKVA